MTENVLQNFRHAIENGAVSLAGKLRHHLACAVFCKSVEDAIELEEGQCMRKKYREMSTYHCTNKS